MEENKFELPRVSEQSPVANKVESSQLTQAENAREQTIRENISQNEVVNFNLPQNNITTPVPVRSADIELKKVENILSKNMENVFLSLDSQTQLIFKQKGEETARKIAILFQTGKAKVKKVLDLILDWLRIIPRVNKHFLQQEAKIKTDEIMGLYQKNK